MPEDEEKTTPEDETPETPEGAQVQGAETDLPAGEQKPAEGPAADEGVAEDAPQEPTDEEDGAEEPADEEVPPQGAADEQGEAEAPGEGEDPSESEAGEEQVPEEPIVEGQPPEEPPGEEQAEPAAGEPEAEVAPEEAEAAGEPAEGEAAGEPEEAEAAEEPEGAPLDEGSVLPAELNVGRLPLIGDVPFWMLGAAVGAAFLIFAGTLAVGLRAWQAPPRPAGPVAEPAPRTAGPAPSVPSFSAQELAAQSYEELLDHGAHRMVVGDYAAAVQLYREAAARKEEGMASVVLARHRLSQALARIGQRAEALQICESLRSLSRPGDELWKQVLITGIAILGEEERWEEFFRDLYLLRANSARYADEASLNRWVAYQRAMAKVRLYLAAAEEARTLYDIEVPSFGAAPCRLRELTEADIVVLSGKYGDGSVKVEYRTGELDLRSEGAPLGRVLELVEQASGLSIEYDGPDQYPVSACLKAIGPEQVLEAALGSVGLQVRMEAGKAVVETLAPRPESAAAALSAALWGAQEFLILYPESPNVPEAYYALSHLYMTQGPAEMALDQLDVLCSQFPRSSWAAYGHYIAGRARYDAGDWTRAERNLLLLADGSPTHPLAPSAFLWAAQSEMELGEYTDAVSCFRRALAHEINEPLAPRIFYNIAFCTEKAGDSPLEVEERYLELRTRHPDTDYARRADYRLARMALESGRYQKAAARYEFFLSNWPLEVEESSRACRELVGAYVHCGDYARAVMLGEVMVASFGHEDHYWQALPDLLEAYRQCGLLAMAVRVLDRCLEAMDEPGRRQYLAVEKAGFLTDMGEHDQAEDALAAVQDQIEDPDLRERARLCEARLLLSRDPALGLELCRQIALESVLAGNPAQALCLMGEYYEQAKQFESAALVYSGKCPVQEEGTQL